MDSQELSVSSAPADRRAVMRLAVAAVILGAVGGLMTPWSLDRAQFKAAAFIGFASHSILATLLLRNLLLRQCSSSTESGFLAGLGVGALTGLFGLWLTTGAILWLEGYWPFGKPEGASVSELPGDLFNSLLLLPVVILAGGWQVLIATALAGSAIGYFGCGRHPTRRHHSGRAVRDAI